MICFYCIVLTRCRLDNRDTVDEAWRPVFMRSQPGPKPLHAMKSYRALRGAEPWGHGLCVRRR